MPDDCLPPECLSNEDMELYFTGGPQLGKNAVMVMLQNRIYKREGDRWYRLQSVDDQSVSDGS